MQSQTIKFSVQADSERMAGSAAKNLADIMRTLEGVGSAELEKRDDSTMDIGTIVSVLATSGAALAVARGAADWMRRWRGVKVVVDTDTTAGKSQITIESTDPNAAEHLLGMLQRK